MKYPGVMAVGVVGLAAALASPGLGADESVFVGRQVFLQKGCFCCHGTEGQGGAGGRLAPDPLPIAAMAAYVRHPTGLMPPYQQQITDEELSNIRAYLNSIPAPRPVRDIPQLNE